MFSPRRSAEFQWFFTALSVRPGRYFAMSAHLLLYSTCSSMSLQSSSADHGSLRMSWSRWLCHRSRHCLPVRPGRCAARTDHLRVPWPSMARSRSSSSAGDQAPLTCVGCVVWGGSVPGGAPKKCRGRRRSQRARECGSPRRAVRRVCGGRGLSRPRDSGVRDLTGGGVWKERRAGEKAAPPSPAALRSRRKAVRAAVRRTELHLAGASCGVRP